VDHEDEDRERLLALLGKVAADFNWRCYAFVLMGNHYHLMAETPEATLSRGMRQLNGVYTLGFNRRHGRVGHLFQGRFKAILVERESHLLELIPYVALNPVRAGLVAALPGVRGRRGGETLQREDRVFAREGEAVRKRLRSSPLVVTE